MLKNKNCKNKLKKKNVFKFFNFRVVEKQEEGEIIKEGENNEGGNVENTEKKPEEEQEKNEEKPEEKPQEEKKDD